MKEHSKKQETRQRAHSTDTSERGGQAVQLEPPSLIVQRAQMKPRSLTPGRVLQLQRVLGNKAVTQFVNVQRAEAHASPHHTGLPDKFKSGIESLSGMSLDLVKVHYNSSQPAQLSTLAYTQGTDIHIAPGQEQHLPHEAWHVVQQAQGRVVQTAAVNHLPVNDKPALEQEADVMGRRAERLPVSAVTGNVPSTSSDAKPLFVQHPPVIQKAGEAKQSLKRLVPLSNTVPDLDQDTVGLLEQAKAFPEIRQTALGKLWSYLEKHNIVEDRPTPEKGQPPIKYQIIYEETPGDDTNLATTQYKSTKTKAQITITVHAALFDNSVPAIYSAIRHELIHLAQNTQQPDDIDEGSQVVDAYMFAFPNDYAEYRNARGLAVGKHTQESIQNPLIEIEAYAWEIAHASETGIAENDTDYLHQTWALLEGYTEQLIKTLEERSQANASEEWNADVVRYWSGYVRRAIILLYNLGLAGRLLAKKLERALTKALNSLPKGLSERSKKIKKTASEEQQDKKKSKGKKGLKTRGEYQML
jgi:Domain of unknown function (DUF4157)